MAASAKDDVHLRKSRDADETGHPLISLDYEMLDEKIIVLVAKDETTGATLAYNCVAKGPADDWVVRQLVRDL